MFFCEFSFFYTIRTDYAYFEEKKIILKSSAPKLKLKWSSIDLNSKLCVTPPFFRKLGNQIVNQVRYFSLMRASSSVLV